MKIPLFLLAALLLQAPARAQVANEQSYTGHMVWHNQVEYHTIQVYQGSGHLRIWTNSNSGGAGFDPGCLRYGVTASSWP
jgi:outer membrane biogenesis lipoprotein LolB